MKKTLTILLPLAILLFSGCFNTIENPCKYTTENYTLPSETDAWLGKMSTSSGTAYIHYKSSAGITSPGSLDYSNYTDYSSSNCTSYNYSQRTYYYSFNETSIILSVAYRGSNIIDQYGNSFHLRYNDKIDVAVESFYEDYLNGKSKRVKFGLPLWPSFDTNVVAFKTIMDYSTSFKPTTINHSKERYTYIGTLIRNGKTYQNAYKITNDLVDVNNTKDYQYFIIDKEYGLLEFKTNQETYTVIYP
ncbi:MAG: hypothetical protein K9I36_07430 [Bacteroidia bacterium]|nr:hypothetical protein [Bacteroidia bacterium]MCF8426547.1 hypothetical protein [Bacteroidia bacterium]